MSTTGNDHVHPAFQATLRDAQAGIARAAYDTHPAAVKLQAIVRAYEACKDDPNVRLPTALMCLLEAARQ